MDFDSAADELYERDPSEFIAARKAAVARAKESGDSALAKDLNALRKPTTTGWALNLLVRVQPEAVDRLLELGAALRSAQLALQGDELRALASQRAAVIAALTDRAAAAAHERGRPLSEAALREIGQSLSAALAEPDVGADLRRGRMLGSVSYSGFGPAALASVPEPAPPTPSASAAAAATKKQPADEARKQAQERLNDAETAAREATSELEAATERAGQAAQKLAGLREALSQAEQECRFADSARRTAEEAEQRAAQNLRHAKEHAAEFDA